MHNWAACICLNGLGVFGLQTGMTQECLIPTLAYEYGTIFFSIDIYSLLEKFENVVLPSHFPPWTSAAHA
jgi:hypothetical protein